MEAAVGAKVYGKGETQRVVDPQAQTVGPDTLFTRDS